MSNRSSDRGVDACGAAAGSGGQIDEHQTRSDDTLVAKETTANLIDDDLQKLQQQIREAVLDVDKMPPSAATLDPINTEDYMKKRDILVNRWNDWTRQHFEALQAPVLRGCEQFRQEIVLRVITTRVDRCVNSELSFDLPINVRNFSDERCLLRMPADVGASEITVGEIGAELARRAYVYEKDLETSILGATDVAQKYRTEFVEFARWFEEQKCYFTELGLLNSDDAEVASDEGSDDVPDDDAGDTRLNVHDVESSDVRGRSESDVSGDDDGAVPRGTSGSVAGGDGATEVRGVGTHENASHNGGGCVAAMIETELYELKPILEQKCRLQHRRWNAPSVYPLSHPYRSRKLVDSSYEGTIRFHPICHVHYVNGRAHCGIALKVAFGEFEWRVDDVYFAKDGSVTDDDEDGGDTLVSTSKCLKATAFMRKKDYDVLFRDIGTGASLSSLHNLDESTEEERRSRKSQAPLDPKMEIIVGDMLFNFEDVVDADEADRVIKTFGGAMSYMYALRASIRNMQTFDMKDFDRDALMGGSIRSQLWRCSRRSLIDLLQKHVVVGNTNLQDRVAAVSVLVF